MKIELKFKKLVIGNVLIKAKVFMTKEWHLNNQHNFIRNKIQCPANLSTKAMSADIFEKEIKDIITKFLNCNDDDIKRIRIDDIFNEESITAHTQKYFDRLKEVKELYRTIETEYGIKTKKFKQFMLYFPIPENMIMTGRPVSGRPVSDPIHLALAVRHLIKTAKRLNVSNYFIKQLANKRKAIKKARINFAKNGSMNNMNNMNMNIEIIQLKFLTDLYQNV